MKACLNLTLATKAQPELSWGDRKLQNLGLGKIIFFTPLDGHSSGWQKITVPYCYYNITTVMDIATKTIPVPYIARYYYTTVESPLQCCVSTGIQKYPVQVK